MFILTTKILRKLNTYAQYLNLEEIIVVNLLLSLGYVRGLNELINSFICHSSFYCSHISIIFLQTGHGRE